MNSPRSRSRGYTESLATKMDRLADALSNDHAALRAEGVYVDVNANGHVIAVAIDDKVFPGGRRLGPLIASLINQAREQAQTQSKDLVGEVQADPRIGSIIEKIGDAPERALPRPAAKGDLWDEDDDPYRRRSPIAAD